MPSLPLKVQISKHHATSAQTSFKCAQIEDSKTLNWGEIQENTTSQKVVYITKLSMMVQVRKHDKRVFARGLMHLASRPAIFSTQKKCLAIGRAIERQPTSNCRIETAKKRCHSAMLVIQHGECRLGQKFTHAHMTREVMIPTKPGVKFLLISVQASHPKSTTLQNQAVSLSKHSSKHA